jgi:Tfp pilus assembly protein FimT
MSCRTHRAGFTLVELILVVSLMMLAASAVASNLDSLIPQARIEACARTLASDIAAARASAIAQGLPYRLEYSIDPERPQYRIALPFKTDGGVATEDETRVYTNWKDLPEGVKIVEVTAGTRIHRTGICRIDMLPNGNTIEHVVHLERQTPKGEFYLVVQGLTGFVQFFGAEWRPDVATEGDFR